MCCLWFKMAAVRHLGFVIGHRGPPTKVPSWDVHPMKISSYMIYRTAPFSMTLNDPYPQFQCHAILWRWISQKRYDIQTWFQWNTNSELYMPHSTVSFRMTMSDLEWLNKIFNDTKRRAVSLRQLSFLWQNTGVWRTDGQTDRQTSCDGIVRAMHTRRAIKIVIFDHCHTISEMIQDRVNLVWNANRKSYAIYRMVLFPMILSDL